MLSRLSVLKINVREYLALSGCGPVEVLWGTLTMAHLSDCELSARIYQSFRTHRR